MRGNDKNCYETDKKRYIFKSIKPTLVKNREIRRTCGTNILAHILLYIFIEKLYQGLVKRIKEKLSKVKI